MNSLTCKPIRVSVGIRKRSVPVVRCAVEENAHVHDTKSNARVEKLKEVAKHAVTERRKTCVKAANAVQNFFDAERELQKKFVEEVVLIIKQDTQRIHDQIRVVDKDDAKPEVTKLSDAHKDKSESESD